MSEKVGVSCGECRFFQAVKATDGEGQCRLHPPEMRMKSFTTWVWPEVKAGMWCGEFKQRTIGKRT